MFDDNDEFEDGYFDDDNENDLEGYEIEGDDLVDYELMDDKISLETEEIEEDDELFSIPCSVCGEIIDMREAKYVDGEAQHMNGCNNG